MRIRRTAAGAAIGTLFVALTTGPPAGQAPAAQGRSGAYAIEPVPLDRVTVADGFWLPRMRTNREVTIPHILRENEATGRVANFRKAAGTVRGKHEGRRYNDSDVYKAIEAASYALAAAPDAALDRALDEVIAAVAAAQQADGYLYTARTIDPKQPAPGAGPERWSYLHTSHELYNAGHLYEAAVAHFQATGKRTLLDVAIRNADLVCRVFGPDGRKDAPGHQEIELALVKLFRATGNRTYLDRARFFLEQRGREHTVQPVTFAEDDPFAIYNDRAYRQDHLPVEEQTRAVGHAVRATYMFAGMTDVATHLGIGAYASTLEAAWRDVTSRRLYVTGGLGSQGRTEAFGDDYDLPNRRAYAETCASIGGMLWYYRMFQRSGDASYLDVFERTLYNGYLSGVSLAGDTFFYQNPLESDGSEVARSPYFDVACCPANLARLMGQLPGLVYATRGDEVFVNLFVAGSARIDVAGSVVEITQATAYPRQGRVTLRVTPQRPVHLTLRIRIPGWSRDEASPDELYRFSGPPAPPPTMTVDGRPAPLEVRHGFARVERTWDEDALVVLDLPMPVRRVLAHEGVAENRGRAAIQRGPLVYAIEAADHGGSVLGLRVPLDADLGHEFRSGLLGGVEVVTGRAFSADASGSPREAALVAVPYFAWANRGKGEMSVWIRY